MRPRRLSPIYLLQLLQFRSANIKVANFHTMAGCQSLSEIIKGNTWGNRRLWKKASPIPSNRPLLSDAPIWPVSVRLFDFSIAYDGFRLFLAP